MRSIVNKDGSVNLGFFDTAVGDIDAHAYRLKSVTGRKVPGFLKKIRYKTFHFAGVASYHMLAGVAIADVGYLTNCFVYVYDLNSGVMVQEKFTVPGTRSGSIRQTPEKPLSVFHRGNTNVRIDETGIELVTGSIRFQLFWKPDPDLKPIRLCTRSGYRGWAFTRKAAPIQTLGTIQAGNRVYDLDRDNAYAITDWTGGFLRRETWWNWAAIAGILPDGRTIGLNLSWGTNETGFTENAFWVNSAITHVGPVCFKKHKDVNGSKWIITSSDGRVDLVFEPEGNRSESINAILVVSRFVQFFGWFSGTLITRENQKVHLNQIPGWAEDHFARW